VSILVVLLLSLIAEWSSPRIAGIIIRLSAGRRHQPVFHRPGNRERDSPPEALFLRLPDWPPRWLL
jgi:hypothetical protein